MDQVDYITIPVKPATAMALQDETRRKAVGQLIDKITMPDAPSAIADLMAAVAAQAQASGLTDAEIDAELAAYNAERRG